jgi:MFS transporter, ACS family, hexuronate transporter
VSPSLSHKPSAAATRFRWVILALVFLATTLNYLDRIIFSVLNKEIRTDLRLSTEGYGDLQAVFQFTYTIGFLVSGYLVDRFGAKLGYGVSVVWWSLAAIGHAFAHTVGSFGFWRGMLGLGESGNFPTAMRVVTEWFPVKDRAFAVGVFNAGTNVASMIGPPLFAYAAQAYGWRSCFVVTGSIGFIWLIAWLWLFSSPRQSKHVDAEEIAYIESDTPAVTEKIGWLRVASVKQTWGFALAKFFADPVWWFYLYWLPPYLRDSQKLSVTETAWSLVLVYAVADVGSVLGGWLSGYFIRKGWPVVRARRITLLIAALCMPLAAFSGFVQNLWLVLALASLATAAHQAWSATLYTSGTDMFPTAASASITGIGGFLGGLGGIFFSAIIPSRIVANYGYAPAFLMMGLFHLVGWLIWRSLSGNEEKVQIAASN